MKRKKITIHTAFFTLQLYWCTKTVETQCIVVLVLFAIYVFGGKGNVRTLSVVLGLLDLLTMIILSLPGAYVECVPYEKDESPDESKESATPRSTSIDKAEVNHNSAKSDNTVREVEGNIDVRINTGVGLVEEPKTVNRPDVAKKPDVAKQPEVITGANSDILSSVTKPEDVEVTEEDVNKLDSFFSF